MSFPSPNEHRFITEMRQAGFTVNQFTFLNGLTVPTVYGSHIAVRQKTTVPIAWKQMGNQDIVYPVVSSK
jgi:hypothetical protein